MKEDLCNNRLHRWYDIIVNESPYGIVLIENTGKIVFCNHKMETITGYTIEDIPDIETWLQTAYPAKDYLKKIREERKTKDKEDPRIREAIITTKHGEKKRCRFVSRYISKNLRLLFVSTIDHQLNEIFGKALPDLYFIIDYAGTFLDFLGGNEKNLYLPPYEFIGKSLQDIFPDTIVQKFEHAIRNIKETTTEITIEYKLFINESMKTYEGRLIPLQKDQLIFIARDITEQKKQNEEKDAYYQLLKKETANIKILHGILPICSSCKNIRDKNGNWRQIEDYIKANSEADFTHTLCPECVKKLYPNIE